SGMESLADQALTSTLGSRYTGTLPYMASEQFENGAADQRTDLWALGIMIYEMLAGRHPIQPLDSPTLWRTAIQLDVPMPRISDEVPEVPVRLAQLVDRCLQKRKEKRIATAAEALVELESLLPSRAQHSYAEDQSPYPGLTAFREDEAHRFFGRG